MANVTTELKVLVKAVGKGELKELNTALNNLSQTAKSKVNTNFKLVSKQLKDIQSTSVKSTKNLRDYRNAWRDIASQLDVATKDFKEATAEAAKLDAQLARVEKRKAGGRDGGGRLASAGKSVAAIAGAGVFGGPEGAIGATVGSAFGPGGAIAGGFVGAQLSGIRKAAGGVGEYVAELNLAKAALAGVSADQGEYNKNIEFAGELSDKYAIRIKDVIKGYTGVTAAAKANNLSLEQTQAIYEGITVSGVAAGKSQEDLQALFLATTQVLSKGKASAEEISGQIGERIPGAVAKFAAANEISLGELARQFKAGEVTIAKFVRFTEQQGEDYAEVAASLATGPEKAGVRLEIALDKAKEAYGSLFLNVGSGIQDLFTKIVDFVIDNEKQFKKYIAIGIAFGQDFIEIINGVAKATFEIFKALDQTIRFIFGDLFSDIAKLLVFFVQKTANLLRKARAERGAREKGTDLFAVRREAEAEVVAEDGGRNYFNIEQSNRINEKYFEKLGVITGEAFAGSFGDRVNALVKSLSESKSFTFAKGGAKLAPSTEDDPGGDPSKASGGSKQLKQKKDMTQELYDLYARERDAGTQYEELLAQYDIRRYQAAVQYAEQPLARQKALLDALETVKKGITKEDERQLKLAQDRAKVGIDIVRDNFKFAQDIDKTIPQAFTLKGLFEEMGETFKTSLGGAINGLIDGTKTLGDAVSGILKDISKMLLNKAISAAIGMLPFAKGGVLEQGKVIPYANGGIVDRPTIFPMAKGMGLMGEAGAEAVMPLKRGRNGKLGVQAEGTKGIGSIIVNVDATGSSAEGDDKKSKELGQSLGMVIQSELIRQKRPGGILA